MPLPWSLPREFTTNSECLYELSGPLPTCFACSLPVPNPTCPCVTQLWALSSQLSLTSTTSSPHPPWGGLKNMALRMAIAQDSLCDICNRKVGGGENWKGSRKDRVSIYPFEVTSRQLTITPNKKRVWVPLAQLSVMEGKEFWTEVEASSVSSGTLGVNIYEMGPGRSLFLILCYGSV